MATNPLPACSTEGGRPEAAVMRGLKAIVRPVARVVVLAHLALALQPLSAIAQPAGQMPVSPTAQAELRRYQMLDEKIRQAQQQGQSNTFADLLPQHLQRAKQLARDLQAAPNNKAMALQDQGRQALWDELQRTLQAIRLASASEQGSMAAMGEQLLQEGAASVIVQRQAQAEQQLSERMAQFERIAAPLLAQSSYTMAPHPAPALAALEQFAGENTPYKNHTPLDPHNLPWNAAKPTPRMPAETQAEWQQRAPTPTSTVQGNTIKNGAQNGPAGLTTIAGLQFTHPPSPEQAPTEADLAETDEIQLTPSIRAKALELNHNPVDIQNWVRNTVEWQPTWGAMQSADTVLQSLRGNAFDIATLTIALLRASKIPARYQWGTIELPTAQAMNWVGGVQKPEAALNLLYQGGVAARGVVSAGRIQSIRMEHAWVSAYVNYAASRGALNASDTQHVNPNAELNAWIPFDSAYKQYLYTAGMDLQTAVPLDAPAILNAAREGASTNEQEGWIQNLNQTAIANQMTAYQNRLKNYLESQAPNATVGDLIGKKIIPEKIQDMLADGLLHIVMMQGGENAYIPERLQWKIGLDLYSDELSKTNNSPALSMQIPMASVCGKKIALEYQPSAAGDKNIIDTAFLNEQATFPAYLVHMTPSLKLEDKAIATGATNTAGKANILTVSTRGPLSSLEKDYRFLSGDSSVIVFNCTGVTERIFNTRASRFNLMRDIVAQGNVSEMLHQIGLGWWGEKYAYEEILASQMNLVRYNLPSHVRLGVGLHVRYSFGIARNASYRYRNMDAKLDQLILQPKDTSTENSSRNTLAFMRTAGQVGSFLEGNIFDQIALRSQAKGASSITLLATAATQGIPIYHITPENPHTITALNTTPDIKNDISQAIAAGMHAIVSRDEVNHHGYQGIGFIIENPQDGSAAYQIDGGLSGGSTEGPVSVYPLPTLTITPAVGILLGSILRELGARFMLDVSGQVLGLGFFQGAAGIAAPTPGPAPDPRVAALIMVIMMITQGQKEAFDKKYPKIPPLKIHKYSSAAVATINHTSKTIRATGPGGTFNPNSSVVYLALGKDPIVLSYSAGKDIDCPPNRTDQKNLAELYQISPNGKAPYNSTDAEAYVHFNLVRQGLYDEKMEMNSNKVIEIVIPENRLLPSFLFPDKRARLYIGALAPGIEDTGVCQ